MMSTVNKSIKVLLVDDEKAVRMALREILERNFPFVQVVGEASGIPEAVREIHTHNPDLLFLDIEMPGYSGLQLLEFFNPSQINFDIVFVTAFNEYAIRAFKIAAFDYLLKPVDKNELDKTLQRFQHKHQQQRITERINLLKDSFTANEPLTQIAVSSLQGIDFIHLSDILLLEASGTYTIIKLVNGSSLTSSKPLGEFEEVLQKSPNFFRTHRSYLINLNQVRRLSSKEGDVIVLQQEIEVPLSRYRKKEFEAAIADYRI
jgi:two-component system, LytTR family, response regulator